MKGVMKFIAFSTALLVTCVSTLVIIYGVLMYTGIKTLQLTGLLP